MRYDRVAAAPLDGLLCGTGPVPIRESARRVGRDVEVVHGDVTALLEAGILGRVPDGRIELPYEAVEVELMLPAARARRPATDGGQTMPRHHIFGMKFSKVYPLYVQKAERKGRTKEEVDEVIGWLTGYDDEGLRRQIDEGKDFETFFAEAPAMQPNRSLIKGVVCGVRVEEVEDPLMREIRYLDKLVDELAKGKAMEKILRQ